MEVTRRLNIYPFNGRSVSVQPTFQPLVMSLELTAFAESDRFPFLKYNSWIPLLSRIQFGETDVEVQAGVMNYLQTRGALEAIKSNQPFAETLQGVNNLSIGVIPITSDGYIMMSRRNQNAQVHAGGVWNFNGGYMTSFLIDREQCSTPQMARNPLLYDIHEQVRRRIHRQEFFGLKPEDISLAPFPNALAYGFYHSLEPEFGWVARFAKTKQEMLGHIADHEAAVGVKEHTRVDFLAVEDLEILLKNQAELLNANPLTYTTDDPRQVILLDDNIGELIGGAFKEITQRELDPSITPLLKSKGLQILLFQTYPEGVCEFPTKF